MVSVIYVTVSKCCKGSIWKSLFSRSGQRLSHQLWFYMYLRILVSWLSRALRATVFLGSLRCKAGRCTPHPHIVVVLPLSSWYLIIYREIPRNIPVWEKSANRNDTAVFRKDRVDNQFIWYNVRINYIPIAKKLNLFIWNAQDGW
jgi:hypothetical protein